MKKSEYIEILRNLQNDLKEECNDCNEFLKKHDCYSYISDMEADSFNSLVKSFAYFFVIELSLNKLNDNKFIILFGGLGILNFIEYVWLKISSSNLRKAYILTCNINNQNEKQIIKLENAIEFFQSSSEEEIQKYLSYKMGDSKKIN